MSALRILIVCVAVAAGVGAVALVNSELQRARSEAETTVQIAPPAPPPPSAPKTDVLVAARALRMGETLRPRDMRWQPWPLESVSEFYVTRDRDPRARDDMQGVVVRRGLVAGEPINESKLLRVENAGVMAALLRDGMRAMAIEIDPETAAGGFILPGDYVDVLLTREVVEDGGSETTRLTHTLMTAVRVLAIDQDFDEETGGTSNVGTTATLELTPAQSEIVALARETGQVSLALRGVAELIGDNDTLIEPVPQTTFDLRAQEDVGDTGLLSPRVEITVVRWNSKQQAVVE